MNYSRAQSFIGFDNSAIESTARHPLYSAHLSEPASLVGSTAEFQSQRHPQRLQGHVREHGRIDRQHEGRIEDHERAHSDNRQPGKAHELLGASGCFHSCWRWRGFGATLLRNRGGQTRDARGNQSGGEFCHVDHRLLAASFTQQRHHYFLQRARAICRS